MNAVAPFSSLAFEPVDYDPFAGGELALVVPTTESQREIWLADQLCIEASLSFNLSVSLRFAGRLDVRALRAAMQDLIDRHDALRASVGPDGQSLGVLERFELPLPISDLADLDPGARDAVLAERLRSSVETPFVLGGESLFRAELLRLAADEHLLLLTAHHIVCDGWSWWVLVQELGALYGLHHGATDKPLATPASFAQFAMAEVEQQSEATHAADEAYWLSRFPGEAPVLELPTDRPRPSQRSFASAREDHLLDEELLELTNHPHAHSLSLLTARQAATFRSIWPECFSMWSA